MAEHPYKRSKQALRKRRAINTARALARAGYKLNPEKASLSVLESAMRGTKLQTTTRVPIKRQIGRRTITLPFTERVPAYDPYAAHVRSAYTRRMPRKHTA